MASALLTRHDLINSYPVPTSRPGLRSWIKKYGFPDPIYLNPNTPAWKPDEVDAWFESRPRYRAFST